MFKLIAIILTAVVLFAVILFITQHRLIYFPRQYDQGPSRDLATIRYHTSQGSQTAFYLPASASATPRPRDLWILLGGNASLALDWQSFAAHYPEKSSGMLLFDYPGYGYCEGAASPETIRESLRMAIRTLAEYLGTTPDSLRGRISVVGHSLGAAAGLDFCREFPLRNIVLLAPFTSMRAMARKAVGAPFDLLLRHRYDNIEVLRKLAALPQKPRIVILHGARDEVIPVAMGRALAAAQPEMITYHELAGVDHNSIMIVAEADIYRIMMQLTTASTDGGEQKPDQPEAR